MKKPPIKRYPTQVKAEARIRALEAHIGVRGTTNMICLHDMLTRIQLLEAFVDAYPNASRLPSSKTSPKPNRKGRLNAPLYGLMRAINANQNR